MSSEELLLTYSPYFCEDIVGFEPADAQLSSSRLGNATTTTLVL